MAEWLSCQQRQGLWPPPSERWVEKWKRGDKAGLRNVLGFVLGVEDCTGEVKEARIVKFKKRLRCFDQQQLWGAKCIQALNLPPGKTRQIHIERMDPIIAMVLSTLRTSSVCIVFVWPHWNRSFLLELISQVIKAPFSECKILTFFSLIVVD